MSQAELQQLGGRGLNPDQGFQTWAEIARLNGQMAEGASNIYHIFHPSLQQLKGNFNLNPDQGFKTWAEVAKMSGEMANTASNIYHIFAPQQLQNLQGGLVDDTFYRAMKTMKHAAPMIEKTADAGLQYQDIANNDYLGEYGQNMMIAAMAVPYANHMNNGYNNIQKVWNTSVAEQRAAPQSAYQVMLI